MLGLGSSISSATNRWLDRKEERAVARAVAGVEAEQLVSEQALLLLARIYRAAPGSSYRAELEGHLDRMLTALSNEEKFEESIPGPDDRP